MIKTSNKTHFCIFKQKLVLFVYCLLFINLNFYSLHAQALTQVGYFDTWPAIPQIIKSTDPAGITYHGPSGHLYIADSEINEIPAIFTGPNVFEVSASGDVVYQEIASGNSEPTGITYNEYDGYFYVSNDNAKTITRYDNNFTIIAEIHVTDDDTTATDPEGITSDPATGNLYVVDGMEGGSQVLIYNSNLTYLGGFSLNSAVPGIDPEGIAFDPDNNHLYIIWGQADQIYQFTTSGTLLQTYAIGGFSPAPRSAQGLTFAPTSDPDDDPGDLALYIADAMVDNDTDSLERDGRVFESVITIADFVGSDLIVETGSEVNFTNLSPVNIVSYSWDFGDSGTSAERDPSHTYNTSGVYSVSLTVTGPLGTDKETKSEYIIVVDDLQTMSFQDGINGYSGTRDTRLNSALSSTNYGSTSPLVVDGDPDDVSTLLSWEMINIPLASTVYTVEISVNVTNTSGGATYEIYDLKQAWIESEATWEWHASGQNWEVAGADGAGDRGMTDFGWIDGSTLGSSTVSLNAAGVSAVQSWVNDPSSNHGFVIQDYVNAHSNGLQFASRETATETNRPKLTVRYSPPDIASVTIAESGSSTDVAEGGATDSYYIGLNTIPSGPVEITVTADGQSEVSIDGSTYFASLVLNFTDRIPQIITVRALDDIFVESSPHTSTIGHAVTGTVSDANYPLSLSIANVLANIADNDVAVLSELKIFLEGAYDTIGDTMRTDLMDDDFIPPISPFAEDPRSVSVIPDKVVDWVLVELRETDTGAAVASKSAFLRNDGRIVADDGVTPTITMDVVTNFFYIVINQRNHLAVMSTNSVQLSSGSSTLYDFSTGTNQYYGSGAKELETGVFGMYTGDANGNNQVQNDDKNVDWASQVGAAGYRGADFNLNGQVQNDDKNVFWNANVGAGTQVP